MKKNGDVRIIGISHTLIKVGKWANIRLRKPTNDHGRISDEFRYNLRIVIVILISENTRYRIFDEVKFFFVWSSIKLVKKKKKKKAGRLNWILLKSYLISPFSSVWYLTAKHSPEGFRCILFPLTASAAPTIQMLIQTYRTPSQHRLQH